MRCSCGKPGAIQTSRREMAYCQGCFEQHISKCVRHEAQEGPVRLKPVRGFFLEAAKAACELARREVVLDEQGLVPGCGETAAAATIRYMLGYTQSREQHFPKSITLQELQTFFKADKAVQLDSITQELIEFEKRYPGTINSINHA